MSMRILFIDDYAQYRLALVQLFTMMGFECEGVGSTAEASYALDRFRPNVVVVDLDLAGAGALIRRARQQRPGGAGVVGLATSDEAALISGIDVLLSRPCIADELVDAVRLAGRRTAAGAESVAISSY